jgi:hypothetical protein
MIEVSQGIMMNHIMRLMKGIQSQKEEIISNRKRIRRKKEMMEKEIKVFLY